MTFSAKNSPPLPNYNPGYVYNNSSESELVSVVLSRNINKPVEGWSCSEVSQFIIELLQLPKIVGMDIRDFINLNNIDGLKLLSLDENQLAKMGFNRLWCYHLSSAIEDLNEEKQNLAKPNPTQQTEKTTIDKKATSESLQVSSKPSLIKSLGKRGGHRAKESIASMKQVGALAQPSNQTDKTNMDLKTNPVKPFTLPQIELTLLKHFMLSETYGFRAELNRIKHQLKLGSEKELERQRNSRSFDSGYNKGSGGGSSWYEYFTKNPTLPVVLSTAVICLFLFKRVRTR